MILKPCALISYTYEWGPLRAPDERVVNCMERRIALGVRGRKAKGDTDISDSIQK